MKYVVGWVVVLVFFVGIAVGGFFLVREFDSSVFTFKQVDELDYQEYDIRDFVKQKITCKNDECTYKKKKVIYTLSKVEQLGKQKIDLEIQYNQETIKNTFFVNIVDRKAPEINLSEKYVIINQNGKFDAKSYITRVVDNFDELNIDDIEIDNPVNVKKIGEYMVTYQVKDSSSNVASATLKVMVKDAKTKVEKPEVNSTSTPITSNQDKFQAKISTSGIYDFTNTLNQDNKTGSMTKEISVGWNTTIHFKFDLSGSGAYTVKYNIANYDASTNITPIGSGYQIYAKDSKDTIDSSHQYSYTFQEEGTYYIYIYLKDRMNNVVLEQKIKLIVKVQEDFDVKLRTSTINDYVQIDFDFIGNANGEYVAMAAAITSSDDDRISSYPYTEEDIILNEGDKAKLYYRVGCKYQLFIVVINEKEEILWTKTLVIEK